MKLNNTKCCKGGMRIPLSPQGKEVEAMIIESNKEIRIENLNAGIYLAEITIDGNVERKKVIILK